MDCSTLPFQARLVDGRITYDASCDARSCAVAASVRSEVQGRPLLAVGLSDAGLGNRVGTILPSDVTSIMRKVNHASNAHNRRLSDDRAGRRPAPTPERENAADGQHGAARGIAGSGATDARPRREPVTTPTGPGLKTTLRMILRTVPPHDQDHPTIRLVDEALAAFTRRGNVLDYTTRCPTYTATT